MAKEKKIKIKQEPQPENEADMPLEEPGTPEPAPQESDKIDFQVILSQEEYDQLTSDLEEAQKKEEEYLENWTRERADFSNYKKRIERDRENDRDRYRADVLERFLPVLDDLELAYKHRPEDGEAASWADGIGLIIRKFGNLLENDGLKKIEVKAGDKLDPNIHMAVSSEDSDEFGSEEIIEILQNGYRMGDKIVRPAIVRVAR